MTHGTLTNKQTGQTLTGKRESKDGGIYLNFHIDGCEDEDVFRTAEWDFTPDPGPLPDEDGYYVSDAPRFKGFIYERTYGKWYGVNNGGDLRSEEDMRESLPLIRLVREDGKPL